MKFRNVYQVAARRLCVGCGACEPACPEYKVRLIDVVDDGIRPIINGGACDGCDRCLQVCPGLSTAVADPEPGVAGISSLSKRWGKVLEIWEGYAADTEVRFKGSSGGLCTALSLFCLESGRAGGVLHVGADEKIPWKNRTFMSRSADALVQRTGSRYSPASPCSGFPQIKESKVPCVFVGKPCDVAGLAMSRKMDSELDRKTLLAVGFFCAGTPSTQGTLELFSKYNVNPEEISGFRYRGMGWPGQASAWRKNQEEPFLQVSYKDSWGFVQKYRPFRCYLCPDLTAEFADISVGDPWYREIDGSDPGRSLILIRTETGRKIFQEAMKAGYVEAAEADPSILYKSQKNLLGKRQAIWGRLLAMKCLGIPYPRLNGFHLFENWLDLPAKEKVKSVLGTGRRIIQRNYFKPLDYSG